MTSVQELLASLDEKDLDRLRRSIKLRDDEKLTVSLLESIVEPDYIGPTWQKNSFGQWILPKHTLGWQIAGWCSKYLLDPRDSKKRWEFTPEQLRYVLWWYAVDENGKFLYQSGVLQRRKGWGKDPLLSVLCVVEMVGPCRFSHWTEDHEPIARPEMAAHVIVAAVTKEQTSNTGDMFPLIMSNELKSTYGIKPGIELIRANNGRQKIQLITGSYRAVEGKRATFSLLNETHHWVAANGGPKMYETIDGNASKLSNRYLAITNAYLPGEESVAESMRADFEKFKSLDIDGHYLYDSVEAKARAPLSGPLLRLILERMVGDSWWTNVDSMITSIMKQSISPARSRRMWFNQVVADEDALHGPETWDPLIDHDIALMAGDEIVLGLDGGKSDDSTALIAIRIYDMAVFVMGMWEKPEGPEQEDWLVDQEEVDEVVELAHHRYSVVGFYSDVAYWETWLVAWEERYAGDYGIKATEKTAIGLDMRSNQKDITLSHEAMMKAIFDGKLKHDGNFKLRRHVLNARRRENKWGVSFGKDGRRSDNKVDAYAAMLLAYMAAVKFRLKGKRVEKKTRRGYFM